MNVLDPQLEALAFDYVSFGIFTVVNNLWTWVALVTAAISFWRISRISGGKSEQQPPRLSSATCIDGIRDSKNHTQPRPLVLETPQPDRSDIASSPSSSSSMSSSTPSVLEKDGVAKRKFVMYYYEDDDKACYGNGDDGDELTVVGERGYDEWTESWETAVLCGMRREEMGWYRCQDFTVINGNVVRLWDGVRGKQYNSGCVVW